MLRRCLLLSLSLWLVLTAPWLSALSQEEPSREEQPQEKLPEEKLLEEVAFRQRLGEPVAIATHWLDAGGQTLSLAEVQNDKAMVLVLSWFDCEGLCPVLLQNLQKAQASLELPLSDYRVVAVSIDPGEGREDSRKLYRHLALRNKAALKNWTLLTGDGDAIAALSDSIGFDYRYDAQRDRFAHPAGLVVVSPAGKISAYLLGLRPSARDLQMALVAAGEGKVGSLAQRALLRCYHFDPQTGQYNLAVLRLLQGLGLLWIVGMLIGGVLLWRRPRQ